MKNPGRKVAAVAAGIVLAFVAPIVGSSPAQAVGPASCSKSLGNWIGAWPSAYAACDSGYGHVQAVGTFRNLAGNTYKTYGAWVGIGKTSTAKAMGLFDPAIAVSINTRFT